MRVKICGITNLQDALHAVECGADALGFVFYPKSPRYITPEKAKHIIDGLPPFVERVGLFVNESVEHIDKICQECNISRAQIHFDVDEAFIETIGLATLPVVRAKSAQDVHRFEDRYRLVDAFSEAYGGTGKRLNLEWFEGVDCSKIILAGGLSEQNVSEVKAFGFYGVDVSSGVELTKGQKDAHKVKQFIDNAKSF
ncbi:MAG: phosphoribosylanthranilate isomerase [Campylobacterota bacterium]|nr:phosphoribosylanthranilate isomerase [Campylobacterota bacterium]